MGLADSQTGVTDDLLRKQSEIEALRTQSANLKVQLEAERRRVRPRSVGADCRPTTHNGQGGTIAQQSITGQRRPLTQRSILDWGGRVAQRSLFGRGRSIAQQSITGGRRPRTQRSMLGQGGNIAQHSIMASAKALPQLLHRTNGHNRAHV